MLVEFGQMKPGVLTGLGPKETWALITWLVCCLSALADYSWLAGGRNPAILASAGFVVVWICYLGVNLFWAGVSHSYGWFF